MCAFARLPEREHQFLLNIAKWSDSALTLAYTSTSEIVGGVMLAPGGTWWDGVVGLYEIGFDVSYRWRRLGIARQLLSLAFEQEGIEDMIVVAVGLSWLWDTKRTGLPLMRYRELIAQILRPFGFVEYLTSEPNVCEEPANIFLARIGHRVDQERIKRFSHRLLH